MKSRIVIALAALLALPVFAAAFVLMSGAAWVLGLKCAQIMGWV